MKYFIRHVARTVATYVLAPLLLLSLKQLDEAHSQENASNIINSVRIIGNQRIENETIFSYLKTKMGDRFDSVRIDESLKSLFATGLFADISLRREGQTLVVQVVENPIINRIAFEGNKYIKDQALSAEVQ